MLGGITRIRAAAFSNTCGGNVVTPPQILGAVAYKNGWKKVMHEYFAFYKQVPTDERLEAIFTKIQSGEVESRVAIVDGEVVAATNFLPHAHTFSGSICYVNDLIVAPEMRGHGIATKLFTEISSYARSKGCSKVYWNTAPNNPARKLYDQVGYVTPWLKYEIDLTAHKTTTDQCKEEIQKPTIVSSVAHKDGWKRVMREYFVFYKQVPMEEKLEATFIKIQSGEVESRVAIVDGEVVAATNFLPHAHTFSGSICYVNDLIVAPQMRGHGIATQLFAEISAYARSKGCSKVYWNTAPNNPARKLYDQVGYVTPWLKYEIDLGVRSKL